MTIKLTPWLTATSIVLFSFLFTPFIMAGSEQAHAWNYHDSYPITIPANGNGKQFTHIDVIGSDFILFNQTDLQLEYYTRSVNTLVFQSVIASGLNVTGITHNSSGNLFVAVSSDHSVKKYSSGSYTLAASYVLDTTNGPYGIAMDNNMGSVYTATKNPGAYKIYKIASNGSVYDFLDDDGSGSALSNPQDLLITNNVLYIANGSTPLSGANSGNLVSYKSLSGGAVNSLVAYQGSDPVAPQMDAVSLIASDPKDSLYMMNNYVGDTTLNIFTLDRIFSQTLTSDNYLENYNVMDLKNSGNFIYYLRSSATGSPNVINEFDPFKAQIHVPEGLDVVSGGDTTKSLSDVTKAGGGISQIFALLKNIATNSEMATVSINLNNDLDWSNGLTYDSDPASGKAFVHGLLGQPGVSSATFALFVPIPAGQNSDSVVICPGATSLAAITVNCPGAVTYTATSDITTTRKATDPLTGMQYWRVDYLTGTGGISILDGEASTGLSVKDTMTRLQAGTFSDHDLSFGTVYGLLLPTDSIAITFDTNFDLGWLDYNDIDLLANNVQLPLSSTAGTDTWGVAYNGIDTLTFTPPTDGTNYIPALATIALRIGSNASEGAPGVNQIYSPGTPGSYKIKIVNSNATAVESGEVTIPIVDSDQVNVTGFVNTYMSFDIDTAVWGGTMECDYDTCLTYENGPAGSNYTVDLGELNSTWVNESNDVAVQHSDGNSGKINSIYLDLSTNAINGGSVYVSSANGALQGPGTNTINTVTDGEPITANSGRYGFWLNSVQFTTGAITPNGSCIYSGYFCALPQATPKLVFDSNSQPLDGGRIRMDIAAAASYTNNPGEYTDTLTFIATATY